MIRESCMPSKEIWEGFFSPNKIVQTLISPTQSHCNIVELGCGYGTFTIPSSELSNTDVFAFDINDDHLCYLQSEITKRKIENIKLIKHDFINNGITVSDGSVDHVMMYNLLHLEDPISLLQEVKRALKEDGTISIIHWRCDITTPRGPDLSIRPTPEQCCDWLKETGFIYVQNKDISSFAPYHYAITARKGKR